MKIDLSVLKSKPAIAVYVALAVLLATVFGFKDSACGIADKFGIVVASCVSAPAP